MRTILIQNTWLKGIDTGWGNGYVVLPKGHKFNGIDYDDIGVDVHGGLTFSECADNLQHWDEITEKDKGCWVVGFDTAHYHDNLTRWPKSEIQKETDRLMSQL